MLKELSNTEIIQLIGTRLRRYRLNLDVTQKEMAEISGVSLPTIQKMESGNAENVTLAVLLKMVRYLGIIENVDNLIPEQPESPYAGRHKERVKHGNKEIQ